MSRKTKQLGFLMIFLFACSRSFQSNPNTTLTVDYYNVREHTIGMGWDNPLNVERLLLGGTRPLTVIFADPEDAKEKELVEQIIMHGLKDKVWIIDAQSPVSQLCQVLMKGGNSTPTLVFLDGKEKTLTRKNNHSILNFLSKNAFLLDDIQDGQYY